MELHLRLKSLLTLTARDYSVTAVIFSLNIISSVSESMTFIGTRRNMPSTNSLWLEQKSQVVFFFESYVKQSIGQQ